QPPPPPHRRTDWCPQPVALEPLRPAPRETASHSQRSRSTDQPPHVDGLTWLAKPRGQTSPKRPQNSAHPAPPSPFPKPEHASAAGPVYLPAPPEKSSLD